MRSGPMRERIEIQRKAVTRGAVGSEVVAWELFASVRADVRPLSGADRDRYRMASAEVTTSFRIRTRPGIVPTMRIMWKGKAYQISEAITEVARRAETVILGYADAAK